MTGYFRVAAGLVMALLICASSAARSADPDFAKFLSWWPGDYSNLAQAARQDGLPVAERNAPTLLFIRRVDLPAFGADVYYAEWQAADAPHKITRQRLYAFTPLPSGGATLALHIFPDKAELIARTGGAYRDPQRLREITPADMAGLKGCDVIFQRTGKAFAGAMVKGACAFPAPDGTPIYSWSQMKLTPDTFSYLDGWFLPDGKPYRVMSREWYVFKKVKP